MHCHLPTLLQSYNTLLTLSHLNDVSDGIITLENDALHRCCTRLMNIPRPSFAVRAVWSTCLAQALRSVLGLCNAQLVGVTGGIAAL